MKTSDYKHLLLAVNFEPESERVVERAQRLRGLLDARLTLLHVIEHIPPTMEYLTLGYSGEIALPESGDLEVELVEVAKHQMDALGEQLDVVPSDRLIKVGTIAHLIEEVASDLGVDLVIIGSHGRHGLLRLFGSTAGTILRHSTCDVLCVKIEDVDD
jgi:universal stress protein A